MTQDLIQYVETKLNEISNRSGVALETLKTEFEKIINLEFVVAQFQGEPERKRYAIAQLWAKYNQRAPIHEYQIIPLGHGGTRLSKKGNPYLQMYGLAKQNGSNDTPTLKRISFFGKNSNIHKEVEFHSAYNGVKLGASNDGNLIGDDRADFQSPSPIDVNGIFEKLGLTKMGYKELFQSYKVTASGYPDDTDLRLCEGHVRRGSTFTKKDGTEGAVYNICITNPDGSLPDEGEVASDGSVIPSSVSVWCSPSFAGIDEGSVVQLLGTTGRDKDGFLTFNAYYIKELFRSAGIWNEGDSGLV